MNLSDKNLLNELVLESREHLDSIEPDLLAMENDSNVSKETINRIFRAIHSIKGGFSFFGMEKIKELSHAMESLMMKMRDGELQVSPDITNALFSGIDKLRIMIDDLDESENVNILDEVAVFHTLASITGTTQPDAKLHQAVIASTTTITLDTLPLTKDKFASIARQGMFIYVITVKTNNDLQKLERSPLEFIRQLEQYGEFIDSWVDLSTVTGLDQCLDNELTLKVVYSSVLEQDLLESAIQISSSQIQTFPKEEIRAKAGLSAQGKSVKPKTSAPQKPNAKTAAKTSGDKASEGSDSIRVKVQLLNQLVNLAGELVLGRNQLMQQLRGMEESGVKSVLDNIDIITSELQECIMSTRMQPISSILSKFPRIIRDLSHALGKEVELVLQGETVELDKSILEALTDPLTHLLRNCVDHGIETPAVRASRGKPQSGKIILHAYHEGGQVLIQIKDDGNGINSEKVKEKAISNGILRPEEAERMSEKDVFSLIFEAGFSTADKVTDVSGRGVGMDVVKTNIENLSGSVDIASESGKGTTVTLQLPLTLAIIPALTLECHDRRFAMPQVSLDELVHLHAKDASRRVEKINGSDVLRLRDKLLPLVRLDTLLKLVPEFIHPVTKERMIDKRKNVSDRRQQSDNETYAEMRKSDADRRQNVASSYNIVVLKVGPNHFGLIVDKMLDTEEIVVKPLSSYLKNCRCYSGATIMGDGHVAMILDAAGIAEMAGLRFSDIAEEENRMAEKANIQSIKESQTFLLFRNSQAEYMALNLALIKRIETSSKSKVEHIGNKQYLKYDDHSMRIIRPSDFLPITRQESDKDKIYVIVPKLVKHPIGIVTEAIVDVVESSAEIDTSNIKGSGIQGSMIIGDKLVLILDIYSLFEQAEPDIYRHDNFSQTLSGKRVLLAEDTAFFRTLEYNYLSTVGCIVDTAVNGKIALEMLRQKSYDVVITDIQMPEMNGFELTNQIKSDPALQHLPVVALTSMRDEALEKQCEESGLSAYEIKLDKDKLLKSLSKIFQPVAKES